MDGALFVYEMSSKHLPEFQIIWLFDWAEFLVLVNEKNNPYQIFIICTGICLQNNTYPSLVNQLSLKSLFLGPMGSLFMNI